MRHVLVITTILALLSPAGAQILNGGFEDGGFGFPQDWNNNAGVTIIAFVADAGMPTEGLRYLQINNIGVANAIPHSNPGGFGAEASSTSSLSQTFTVPASTTQLEFDCRFLSNDTVDFLEASITDGVTGVYNIIHLDTSDISAAHGTSAAGLGLSPLHNVSVDLGAVFPTATSSTNFTLTLHGGNENGTISSFAYFDDFRLTSGTPFNEPSSLFEHIPPATVKFSAHSPSPNRECYNLVSFNIGGAVGAGPVLGLHLDILTLQIVQLPLGTGGAHFLTDGNGDYTFFIPQVVFPSGTTFDHVLLILELGAVDTWTAAQRFVWP